MTNIATFIWFIAEILWNILSLLFAFLVINTILSWYKDKHDGKNDLSILLRFPVLYIYIIVYIAGCLFFTYGKPSLEGLILGPSLPLLAAYFLIITGRLIRSIQPGHNKEVLAGSLKESDFISSIKRQYLKFSKN